MSGELDRLIEYDYIPNITDAAGAELAQLRAQAARVEALEKALRPFAEIGDVFSKADESDNSTWTQIPDDQRIAVGLAHLTVTVGNLRRASFFAHAPAPEQTGEQVES